MDVSADEAYDEAEQQVARRMQDIEDRLLAEEQERDTIRETYGNAWNKFYEWESQYCRSLLMSLQCVLSDRVDDDAVTPLSGLGEDAMEVDGCSFEVLDMETRLLTALDVEEVDTETIFVPHPKYEACTPASQIIATDDAPDWLAFIPYADEPGFPWRELLRDCRHLLWQDCIRDPDVGLIALEALHQLEAGSMSHNMINVHGVLPNLFPNNEQKGLVSRLYNRDLVWGWPDNSKLPARQFSDYEGTGDHIHEYVDKLCQHTGCLYHMCLPHKEVAQRFPGKPAFIKNENIKKSIEEPCESCCLKDRDVIEEPTMKDARVIQAVLALMPDELPCHVATIVKAACYQVFNLRCQRFPDHSIHPVDVVHAAPGITFHDEVSENHEILPGVDFCYHQGPCGHQCICFRSRTHCKRGCRCDLKCKLRWKGCKCKQEECRKLEKCPCKKEARECDPEFCGPSKHRRQGAHHICNNMPLQRNEFPLLVVKNGEYGQGAFATNAITKNTVIGEYVAELLSEQFSHMGIIHTHLGLNYAFTLNKKQYLDAAWVGNDTRYLNHDKDKMNMYAAKRWVDGEHRIALIATKHIKDGQELLFDYGDNYWSGV